MQKQHSHFVSILILCTFASIAFINSCSDENDNPLEPQTTDPYVPFEPFPADNESEIDTDLELKWSIEIPPEDSLIADSVLFDLYFGTESDPPLLIDSLDEREYLLDILELTTRYYWKIVTHTGDGETITGDVWSFTTRNLSEPYEPSPTDGEFDISTEITLNWRTEDRHHDPIYDVYFGKDSNPSLLIENTEDRRIDIDALDYASTYYWKVIIKDAQGRLNESPVWRFDTRGENDQNFRLGNTRKEVAMVWIEPGTFEMGSDINQSGAELNETPQHTVAIQNGFWIGKYEVMEYQWLIEVDNASSRKPQTNISWIEIQTFLDFLNESEAELKWRLPTEAEWEYVCRAGANTRFYWGADPEYSMAADYACIWKPGRAGANLIRTKEPNDWNIYDLAGNVWEWCADYYHSTYQGAPDNGSAWIEPETDFRVIRGGSWRTGAEACRSSNRHFNPEGYHYDDLGFRLVRNSD